jgi:hypothetical protein
VLTIALVTLIGRSARHYIGKKLIELGDELMLRVPLLNKIYSTVKQVKDALAGQKSSFQQAVLVEFPRAGMYSLGFITSNQTSQIQAQTPRHQTPRQDSLFLFRNRIWSGCKCPSRTPLSASSAWVRFRRNSSPPQSRCERCRERPDALAPQQVGTRR